LRGANPRLNESSVANTKTRIRTVGLLALQGDFHMHRQAVESLGYAASEVRTVEDLATVDCLIIPGGESSTMRKLMDADGLTEAVPKFAEDHPIMGTCAGLILLGKSIEDRPDEPTLGLIDCDLARNAYGRQFHSFRNQGTISLGNGTQAFEMVFIRAPKISRLGNGVEVLGRLGEEPTMIRQGRILCMTFHPELTEDTRIHGYFLTQV
jgi:5'-phosphate synthase pdxT subunit